MLKVDVNVEDQITGDVDRIKKELAKVPNEGLKQFRDLTPIRSGNARRRTTLQGDTIQANYPYAQRLDEGYSKQAPKGMTLPWEQWFKKRIQQIMGR